jgi:hypothetical protein
MQYHKLKYLYPLLKVKKINRLIMIKKILFVLLTISYTISFSQTPIQMYSQANNSYTETFADIDNWVFKTTPEDGTFTYGIGAAAWKGVGINATGTIPSALKTTHSSTFFQIPPSGSGGYSSGLYKSNGKIELLSTGTTNNTTAIAIEFFMDFTGVNAGTLSFDWASVNNSSGNRSSSLKVYASIDGTTYVEITGAEVLNFTNNNPTAGSIVNIAMPTIFNNSSSARLRFYYYNGTGGSTGSRPRLSLDNVKVTSVPTTPCITPTAQPTNFSLGSVIHNSINFSFNNATPQPNNYFILMSNNSNLTAQPINGVNYNIGDALGDATVVGITNNTNFTANGLDLSTTYYFFIFSVNNSCTGGPLYNISNPLTGNGTTTAGALPCVAPSVQPTNLVFSNITTNSIKGSFTLAANTDEYLIIRSLSPTFSGTLNNGTTYNGGNILGNGMVVTRTAGNTFTANNLNNGTTYYFFVFGLNNQNCTGGSTYNSVNPLTSSTSTIALPPCVSPNAQPTLLQLSSSNNYINGYFAASNNTDGYLIVRTAIPTLNTLPQNGINYAAGNGLGNGTVIQNNASTAFIDINLQPSTIYYYHVFAKNSVCTGNIHYLTTNPLTGNTATTLNAVNNWYYGNLHSHSSHSDGNQDNLSFTPADDYAYAKNSLCMDFLGISDHNHASAGMSINNWQPGLNAAATATTSSFLALYGMEWGVISNGGHVLVYGTNQLIGWETNNYNVYVPKSDYLGTPNTTGTTGLFRVINELGGNAFATFAHPSFSDYNGIANVSYNASADSALVGSAVASGIAYSTNTTYSNPPSSFGYLDFYNRMLSKGYHIGPTMDHDNHYTNFGRSNNNRLVVYSPSISSNDFYSAMRSRNFYATEDCDTKVVFNLNNKKLGSITTDTLAPAISVYAYDHTNPGFTPTIKLMYGVSGSGINPTQIYSTSGNTLNYTDFDLPIGINGYYYADISIAGNRTITAPIWYTKELALPLTVLTFNATINLEYNSVNLNWKTSNEINCSHFIVEKSEDGVQFFEIDKVNAKNISGVNNYGTIDKNPFNKITYYRLKMVDKDGKFNYSKIVVIQLNKQIIEFSILPNPVRSNAIAKITTHKQESTILKITDLMGKVVMQQALHLNAGTQQIQINCSNLQSGQYTATLFFNNKTISRKLIKW